MELFELGQIWGINHEEKENPGKVIILIRLVGRLGIVGRFLSRLSSALLFASVPQGDTSHRLTIPSPCLLDSSLGVCVAFALGIPRTGQSAECISDGSTWA